MIILIIPGDFYISIENKLYNKKFTKVLLVAKTTKCKLSIGCLLQACDFPWKYLIDKIWNSSFYYEYMNKTFHILFLAFVDVWCKINKIINLHNLHNWINYIFDAAGRHILTLLQPLFRLFFHYLECKHTVGACKKKSTKCEISKKIVKCENQDVLRPEPLDNGHATCNSERKEEDS
jgi:hypothetical protein